MFVPNSTESMDEQLRRIDEESVLQNLFNIDKIPCLVKNPTREDNHPSLSIYRSSGGVVRFKDHSTGEQGTIVDLIQTAYGVDFKEAVRIAIDQSPMNFVKSEKHTIEEKPKISVSTRKWNNDDIKYWNSFGISIQTLNKANVYPIKTKIMTDPDGTKHYFGTDRLAYAYVEKKEGNISIKIYQPLNTSGFKWCGSHDKSVISLWTLLPEKGDVVIICSSLKDALCIQENTGFPCIAMQSENTIMSETAQNVLRNRFKHIFVIFDNDIAGWKDSYVFCEKTGFANIILPKINNQKDASDIYRSMENKEDFKKLITKLITDKLSNHEISN